jgi:hypothetical protein
MIKLVFVVLGVAHAASSAEWSNAVEVRHDENLCVSYQARLDGPFLVVRASLESGWHTFAMDNRQRAEEKLAGKKSLGIDHPTEIVVTGGLEAVGPWYQLRRRISLGPSYDGSVGASNGKRCLRGRSGGLAGDRRGL